MSALSIFACSVLFGFWGWLVVQVVLERTGSEVLAALLAALFVSVVVCGFGVRKDADNLPS